MPRIIETTVYTIDELSDEAKDAARCWYRRQGLHDEWYDFVYEDFETICRILGVTLATTPVRLYGGGTRDRPRIMFSGFANQGDGACFECWWSHARGSRKAIRAHAPKDEELHRIADVLQETAKRNLYQLNATARHRGRYCHEYTMA
ncbi:MAG: antitoxin of toxin-antitoxin stability system, partial [Rhodospirillaceae bacterium]|nr:antitoxin of toxin-antitoxin stability system [Rhodospirillaceae bacterium]